jgi:hypothetical protein
LAFILAAATVYTVLQKVKDLNSDLGATTNIEIVSIAVSSQSGGITRIIESIIAKINIYLGGI